MAIRQLSIVLHLVFELRQCFDYSFALIALILIRDSTSCTMYIVNHSCLSSLVRIPAWQE